MRAAVSVFTAQPVLLDASLAGEVEGFALFGPQHLAWLVFCAALITALVRWYRHLRAGETGLSCGEGAHSLRLLRCMAAAVMALLISDDILMAVSGAFRPAWWPLHICNFAEFVCVAYAVRPNRACRELLLTFGLTGACMALAFPGWTYCPAYTWPVICGFGEHSLIFAISLCAVSEWRVSPRWRDALITAAFAVCYTLFFRWFNAAMGTNFGFVTVPEPGSPLELWADALGNPGYLVPYALAFACGVVALHAAVALQRRIGRRRACAQNAA